MIFYHRSVPLGYARISNTPEAEHSKAEYEGFAQLYLNDGQQYVFWY
jgi:hypothetical protein